MAHSYRKAALLSRGRLVEGTLLSKTRTNVEVNEAPVYSLTYSYAARSGEAFERSVRTSDPARYESEHAVMIAYDPRRPSRGVFLNTLPGMTKVEGDWVRTEVDSSTMALACLFGMLLFGLIASSLYATLMYQARAFW
ncbi:DUF3592 domain-containing protein [Paenibacillus xanthanilyticus]|uniref:DUF3592 domain-containing protein n=1 Tax=Paenibacillus xanthanilyticus TaxID=1783531 RepID=A0ABV8K0J3_9BACL